MSEQLLRRARCQRSHWFASSECKPSIVDKLVLPFAFLLRVFRQISIRDSMQRTWLRTVQHLI